MSILHSNQFSRLGISLILGLFLAGLGIFTLAGPPDLVRAAGPICTVNSGGGVGVDYTTIQAAIADAGCTTINVTTVGTHNESLNITRNLTLNGAGKTSTVIDAGGSSRVMTVTGAIVVHINNLRITGGDASSAPTSRFGGGILVTGGAALHSENLQIDNNIARNGSISGFGGGLAVINSSAAYLTGTMIVSNVAHVPTTDGTGQGGGIYVNTGILSVSNSRIMTNSANTDDIGEGLGGGMFANANSQITLSGNTWQGNVAHNNTSGDVEGSGGAIAIEFPTGSTGLTITNEIFTGNIANASNSALSSSNANGGAIYLNTTNTGGGVVATLNRITMTQNIAKAGSSNTGEGRGGAIFARHTTLVVKRANIYNNKASDSSANDDGSGGGIYIREPLSGDFLEVENSILAGNTAFQIPGTGDGAQLHIDYIGNTQNRAILNHVTIADDNLNPHQGIYYRGTTVGDKLLITNTIIASHTSGIDNLGQTFDTKATYMLFYGNSNNQKLGSTVFLDKTGWITDTDPQFINPAINNYHISSGSPAIDVGLNEITIDIDGETRPKDGDKDNTSTVDIGADEFVFYEVYVPIILKAN